MTTALNDEEDTFYSERTGSTGVLLKLQRIYRKVTKKRGSRVSNKVEVKSLLAQVSACLSAYTAGNVSDSVFP